MSSEEPAPGPGDAEHRSGLHCRSGRTRNAGLQSIGSPHIRAHAAEGALFRRVWEVAADAIDMPCLAFPEKDFEAFTIRRLQLQAEAVRERLAEFGRATGRPWRSDEKAAAMAAWLALAARSTI